MKAGTRALGVAESFRSGTSTLAGAVVRADRVVDGLAFESCTVGGTDATDAIADLFIEMDREDVRYLLVAGVALAWYNVVDLPRLHERVDRPVLSVTFEESEGLAPAIREAFDEAAREERLATYRRQPPREPLTVNDQRVFVRWAGCDGGEARDVVRAFTPDGGRPEPVRVARMAARAGRDYRERSGDG